MNKKYEVQNQEVQDLIQKHKFESQYKSNFLMNTLNNFREKEIVDGSVVNSEIESINSQEYYDNLKKVDDEDGVKQVNRDMDQFIISPFSRNLNIFDLFTCNLVIYQCIMLPFLYTYGQQFFSPRAMTLAMAAQYLINFIFVIDVFLGFRKAFIVSKTGMLEQNAINIAKNYIQFYFWIDCLAAIPFRLFTQSPIL